MGRNLEWPPGGGRKAYYEVHEVAIVQRMVDLCERGEISQKQLGHELGILHNLKVELDARVVPPPLVASGTGLRVPARLHFEQGTLLAGGSNGAGSNGEGSDGELPESPWPQGHVGPEPEALIKDAFKRFHHENPHVYVELVKLARRLTRRGHSHIGIKMLFEVLRYRHALRTAGDTFKLNNNYHSYYARLIMRNEPDLRGAFELRKLHGPAA